MASVTQWLADASGKWNRKMRGTAEGYVMVAAQSSNRASYHWTSADDTDAPTATAIADYTVGVSADGASTGIVYWVIDGAWVSTTATVATLFGGAP